MAVICPVDKSDEVQAEAGDLYFCRSCGSHFDSFGTVYDLSGDGGVPASGSKRDPRLAPQVTDEIPMPDLSPEVPLGDTQPPQPDSSGDTQPQADQPDGSGETQAQEES